MPWLHREKTGQGGFVCLKRKESQVLYIGRPLTRPEEVIINGGTTLQMPLLSKHRDHMERVPAPYDRQSAAAAVQEVPAQVHQQTTYASGANAGR